MPVMGQEVGRGWGFRSERGLRAQITELADRSRDRRHAGRDRTEMTAVNVPCQLSRPSSMPVSAEKTEAEVGEEIRRLPLPPAPSIQPVELVRRLQERTCTVSDSNVTGAIAFLNALI